MILDQFCLHFICKECSSRCDFTSQIALASYPGHVGEEKCPTWPGYEAKIASESISEDLTFIEGHAPRLS